MTAAACLPRKHQFIYNEIKHYLGEVVTTGVLSQEEETSIAMATIILVMFAILFMNVVLFSSFEINDK